MNMKTFLLLFALLSLILLPTFAQQTESTSILLDRADALREKGELEQADEIYKKVLNENPSKFKLYKELADSYLEDMGDKLKEIREYDKRIRQEHQNILEAAEMRKSRRQAIQDEAKANIETLSIGRNQIVQEKGILAEHEAHYRKLYLDQAGAEDFYAAFDYGKALYHIGPQQYGEAEKHFKKCHRIAPREIGPYQFRLRIAQHYKKENEGGMEWPMASIAEEFISEFEGEKLESMDLNTQKFLITSYSILMVKAFNPKSLEQPLLEDLDCQAAVPLANKVLELDPANVTAKSITALCK